jgi:hypothetical protein
LGLHYHSKDKLFEHFSQLKIIIQGTYLFISKRGLNNQLQAQVFGSRQIILKPLKNLPFHEIQSATFGMATISSFIKQDKFIDNEDLNIIFKWEKV